MYNGLCAKCVRSKEIRSDRGSLFTLCTRGLTDPAWPKYPRLPVLQCTGFEAGPLRIIFLDVADAPGAPIPGAVSTLNRLVAESGARLIVIGADEVQNWLEEHRAEAPARSFVILTTRSLPDTLPRDLSDRAIRMDVTRGLTGEQAAAALAILDSVL